MIEQDKLVVTQANKLAEASYTMSLEEKRVVMLMVSLVRREDHDFKTYRIPISDIRDYLGLSSNKLYGDIKRVADSLRSRGLLIEKPNGGFLSIGWVSSAEYKPKGEDGADVACLELCFDPKLKPYLLTLKEQFSSYMLQNVAGLRSFYSIRFYELLRSRRRLASTTFDVTELRKILKAESKYTNYKDFRMRVILPAQTELAGKTDLAFDFSESRKGRKVMTVTFHIRDVPSKPPRSVTGATHTAPRPSPTRLPVGENDRQPPLLPPTEADRERERLYAEAITEGIQNGVREGVMRDLLSSRDPRHVMENIELARKRHMRGNGQDDVNLAGLTVAAITNDYAADGRTKREEAAARAVAREQEKAERVERESREAAEQEARKRAINARLDAMPAEEREALRAAFIVELKLGKFGLLAVSRG